jgi:hypothetical protein
MPLEVQIVLVLLGILVIVVGGIVLYLLNAKI